MADETQPAGEPKPADEPGPAAAPQAAVETAAPIETALAIETATAVETAVSDADKRRWPRVKLDARVVLSYANLDQLVSGPLSDISLGGLFIRTVSVRPLGTALTIKVIARDEPLEFEAQGRVVRVVRLEDSGPDGQPVPGMGVEFGRLAPEARSALKRLIDVALQQNLAAR